MGKIVNRQVIDGRMVVTQTRRTPEDGLHVDAKVYAGPTEEGEPIGDWALPYQLRYDLDEAAQLAASQTRKEK